MSKKIRTQISFKALLSAIVISITLLHFSGCHYDKEITPPTNNPNCDTTTITYSSSIQNIFATNCIECHSPNSPRFVGIQLDTYETLRDRARDGSLLYRITTTNAIQRMPRGKPALSPCDINKIKAWINRNTPN